MAITINQILVVCVGNVCRSPAAEIIFRHYDSSRSYSSAGLHAVVGRGIEPNTAQALRQNQFTTGLAEHRGRQITANCLQHADLVLTMEQHHRQFLAQQFPHFWGKVNLLGKWSNGLNIADPYKKDYAVHEQTIGLIIDNVLLWLKHLS